MRPNTADAQGVVSLRCAHMSEGMISLIAAHILFKINLKLEVKYDWNCVTNNLVMRMQNKKCLG